mmetsp:Transcript_1851/g.7694  ORF Transcript_1851/g.7694 Transcript_1851/m.7694 type:complete len:227 (+) Transcript_1851:740-1420(+)
MFTPTATGCCASARSSCASASRCSTGKSQYPVVRALPVGMWMGVPSFRTDTPCLVFPRTREMPPPNSEPPPETPRELLRRFAFSEEEDASASSETTSSSSRASFSSSSSYSSFEEKAPSLSFPSTENAPSDAPRPAFTSHLPFLLMRGYRFSGGKPYSLVWIHAYADAMLPVAHPRSRSSQSMSEYGDMRARVPSATNRAASTTAAVLYAQHPAHAPWCTTSPKST